MSCYIVEENNINQTISFLINCSYSNDGFKSSVYSIIKELGYNLNWNEKDKNPGADKLGLRMLNLNEASYSYRYDVPLNTKRINKYKFNDITIKGIHDNNKYLFQILKSIQCYLYQCNEGNLNEDEIFKALKQIENLIKDEIINANDFYKNAKWE